MEGKAFFFEKKKQKTGAAVPGPDPGTHAVIAQRALVVALCLSEQFYYQARLMVILL